MAGSVTVKDIAQAASVSLVTVSRVLNNYKHVSHATRQRVLKAAADIGYFDEKGDNNTYKHYQQIQAGSQALQQIGFFFFKMGDIPAENPFWAHILSGIEDEAKKNNIKVVYRSINDLLASPEHLQRWIESMEIDGILLIGPPEASIVHLVQNTHVPVVLIDTDIPGQAVDAVHADYFGGTRQIIEGLYNLGHRHIAHINDIPINNSYSVELRYLAYRATLTRLGLPVDERLLISISTESGLASGYVACRQLMERNVPFSAIFCVNDQMAVGALKALQEAGLRVPEDVSLVGFDDIELARHLTPALTTIHINMEEMGGLAVKRLMTRKANPQAPAVTSILKVKLIKRQSIDVCSL